jgi:hypothetical protein
VAPPDRSQGPAPKRPRTEAVTSETGKKNLSLNPFLWPVQYMLHTCIGNIFFDVQHVSEAREKKPEIRTIGQPLLEKVFSSSRQAKYRAVQENTRRGRCPR